MTCLARSMPPLSPLDETQSGRIIVSGGNDAIAKICLFGLIAELQGNAEIVLINIEAELLL